jgi:hypothetical protein
LKKSTLAGVPGSRVAASLHGGGLHAFVLDGQGGCWGVEPVQGEQHLVYRREDLRATGHRCGGGILGADGAGAPHAAPLMTGTRYAEFAIDADYPLFLKNGSSAQATLQDVEMITAAVNAIFERDAFVSHRITGVVVRSNGDPYTTNDASQLLSQFRSDWNGKYSQIPRDLVHLFTGRSLNNGVAGVAYVGALCGTAPYALSATRFTSHLLSRVGVTAHELGHNWGSGHCSGSSCYIMCPQLGGCGQDLTRFSAFAIQRIMGVRSAKNACLDDGLPPTLSAVQPTQVSSLGGQTVRITGTYLGNATGVELGGLLLPLHVWQAVDDRNLDLEMPEARNLGPSSLRVRNSLGWSNSLSIQYVRAQPPEMRTSRDWLAGASLPLQYRFAAAPHGIWVALLALSPDTTPVLGGQLLSHAIPIQAGLLDARGLGLLYVWTPAALQGLTLHGQIAAFDANQNWDGLSNRTQTLFW